MTPTSWRAFISYLEKDKSWPVIVPILKKSSFSTFAGDQIYVSCINSGMTFFLEKKRETIEELLSKFIGKPIKIEFFIKEQAKSKKTAAAPLLKFVSDIKDGRQAAGLQKHFSFDNFAVSSTNQIAFAAAQAICQAPKPIYNPLFIYGGVGVGKTHLLQAMGNNVLEKNPGRKILYCSSEDFTNDLIESIRSKNTYLFRKKYRDLYILIIDDIQFIAGKNSAQEECFHTFNTIIKHGGQVVLSSDQPAKSIKNLEDRLRSRFSGGLTIDIQKPDFELRTAILLIKAGERNINIDIEAAKLIAEKTHDTRELEGKLLGIYSSPDFIDSQISRAAVEKILNKHNEEVRSKINSADVIRTVCSYYNIRASLIKNPTRKEAIVLPRQIIMYILRHSLKMKLEEIGFLLKRKDHTTIIHGISKITQLILKNENFKNEIDKIVNLLALST